MTRSTEQRRAAHAWEKAREGVARHGRDYVNDAKGLPALIMNSGLMQVMAFLRQKGGRHEALGRQLREWLGEQGRLPHDPDDFEGFMEYLLQAEPREFQALTAEAFAWLKWLRQMAPAVAEEG